MSAPDTSSTHYSPYIRLTKKPKNGDQYDYFLWLVTFIPDNFTIPHQPQPSHHDHNTHVHVHVESGGAHPSGSWKPFSIKVKLPEPLQSNSSVIVNVYLNDPQGEGSGKMEYDEAEEE